MPWSTHSQAQQDFMLLESLPDPGKGLRCLPGTLLGPVSESVVACVGDQAGGYVGSTGDSSLLKGVEQLCTHTKGSQSSTTAASMKLVSFSG